MKKITSVLKQLWSSGKESKETREDGREYLAEQLEARVLYSGTVAPDASVDDQPVQEAPADYEAEGVGADGSPVSAIEAAQQASAEMEQFVSEGIQIAGGETDIAEDQGVVILNPEVFGDLGANGGLGALSQEAAQGVLDAAAERWSVSGVLTDDQGEALGDVSVQVADLEGDLLVLVSDDNSTILLDIDAAGRAWFVDGTPLDDSEFTDRVSLNGFRAESGTATEGVDVLTILMEAQGALLGVDGVSAGREVSATGLEEGLRRIPIADEALTNPDEVTTSLVADLANAAAQRWEDSGLTGAQLEALADIEYRVVDLSSGIIGSAEDGVISIDIDAAGNGWFVDLSPQEDSEFGEQSSATSLRASEKSAAEGIDLLSVIMHEQGHILGLEHVEESSTVTIMTDLFSEGDRRLIEEGEAEGAIAGSLDGVHFATANFQEGVSPTSVYATGVTYIRDGVGNLNGDPEEEVILGISDSEMRVLLEFDLSSYSATTAESVELAMTSRGLGLGGTFTANVYEYGFDFDETTATWSSPGAGDITAGGNLGTLLTTLSINGSSSSDGDVYTFTNSPAFTVAVNNALGSGDQTLRLLIDGVTSGSTQFVRFYHDEYSGDSDSHTVDIDWRPKLTLNPEESVPGIADLNVGDDGSGVAVDTDLVVTFDQNVQKGSAGDIVIRKTADDSAVETINVNSSSVTISGAEVVFDPASDLDASTGYYVEIEAGAIEDTDGNLFGGLSGNSAWNFTTAAVDGITLVSETFIGSDSALNGTTAESFATALTDAGGSATWNANDNFDSDGDVAGASGTAYLSLGNFINDAKGTASGKFELAGTLSPSTNPWVSMGFFNSATPSVGENFTNSNVGLATIIYRNTGELDGFAGPGTSNGVDGPDAQNGDQLLTVALDLTPDGGFNGTDHFGTVTFYQGTAANGTPLGSFTYTTDQNFLAMGFSKGGSTGEVSGLSLTQIIPTVVAKRIITPTVAGTFSTTNYDGPRTLHATIDGSLLSSSGTSGDILNETVGGAGTAGHWLSLSSAVNDDPNNRSTTEELVFELAGATDVDTVHIWPYIRAQSARGLETFDISFSTDGGSNYQNTILSSTLGDFTQGPSSGTAPVQSKTFALQSDVTHIKLSNLTTFGSTDFIALSEIRFGGPAPVGANLPPTVSGLPSNILVTQDVATNVDFSAIEVADAEGDGLTVTLATNTGGAFTASSGGNVTVSGSGGTSLALEGSAVHINAFLDTPGNITYLHGTAGTYGFGADTIEVRVNDSVNSEVTSADIAIVDITGTFQAAIDLNIGGADTGFTGPWTGSSNVNIVDAPDLTYADYGITQTGTTERVYAASDSNDRQDKRSPEAPMTGEIWFSALVNIPVGASYGGITFNNFNASQPWNPIDTDLRVLLTPTSLEIGYNSESSATSVAGTFAEGTTHLLLGKMTVGVGNDTLDVWVDPDVNAAGSAAGLPSANFTSTTVDFADSIQNLGVAGSKGGASSNVEIDAIRLSNASTAFEDVTGVTAPASVPIAGVDFENDGDTAWDRTPDDLDLADGISVSSDWDTNASVPTQDGNANNAGATSGSFPARFEGTGSWTITIPNDVSLDLTEITFDARGATDGSPTTRDGYFYTSLDDAGTYLWEGLDLPGRNADPNWVPVSVELSDAKYQGLTATTVTFFWYAPSGGIDLDTIVVNGVSSPIVDATAPVVTILSPADERIDVPIDANLVVTFNEDIQKGTTGNILIRKSSDDSIVETIAVTSSTVTVSGTEVTIDPTSDLAGNTGFYVEIESGTLEDPAGNDFTGINDKTTWNFTTGFAGDLIAGVDFENAAGTGFENTPDDLDLADGISVSTAWTVSGGASGVTGDQSGGNPSSGAFVAKLDGGTGGAMPSTTPDDYYSWEITIPKNVELDLTGIRFDIRAGTGGTSRWGMFNTSLDGGPDGGTPLWSQAPLPGRNVTPDNWEHVSVDLSDSKYQNLTGTTLTFYWYAGSTGVDIDTIQLRGAATELPLTAVADTGATNEDTSMTTLADGATSVLANDIEDGATIVSHDATSARGAEVTINTNGSFEYDPSDSAELQALAAGQLITDTFDYTITDGAVNDTGTVSIEVTGTNDDPTAISEAAANLAENALNGTVVHTVSADDVDSDDDAASLNYSITNGDNGAFAIDGNGQITVSDNTKLDFETTPSYSLEVTVTDRHGAAGVATITVALTNAPDNPTIIAPATTDLANPNSFEAKIVDGRVQVTIDGELAYDTALADVDEITIDAGNSDDTLTIDDTLAASGLTINFNGDGETSTNPGDQIILAGGGVAATFRFDNNSDGAIILGSGATATTINYTGLEPITSTGVTDAVLNFTGGAETITITDDAGMANHILIDSDLGESLSLDVTGLTSLTINAGSGADVINLTSLDANFVADLIINGGAGADTVDFGAVNLAGDLSVAAETVTQSGAIAVGGTASFSGANYESIVLREAPAAYYRFEETSGTAAAPTVGSISGTYHNGVVLGDTGAIATATSNNAAHLDGSNDFVSITGALPASLFSDNNYSVEVWFNQDILTSGDDIISMRNGGDTAWAYLLETESNGKLRSYATNQIRPTTVGYSPQTWNHAVVVNDGGTMRFFLNGVEDPAHPAMAPVNFAVDVALGRLTINNGDRAFDGLVDEFAVYDDALTASQIQEHFNAATATTNVTLTNSANNFNTVQIVAGTASIVDTDEMILGVSSVTGSLTVDSDSTITQTGDLSGSGVLVKEGAGTLALNQISTHTGGTNVNDGTLDVDGTIEGGTVSIAAGATLTGSGTIDAKIDGAAGSIIRPDGDLTLGDGSADGFATLGSLQVDAGDTVTILDLDDAEVGTDTVIEGSLVVVNPRALAVDIGQNTSGDNPLQAGFQGFNRTGNGSATHTQSYASDLLAGTGNSVDVTIINPTHYRDYPALTGPFAGESNLFSDSVLRNANGTMTLRLENLVDGTYDITTYHHDTTGNGGGIFNVNLTDGLVTNQTVATGLVGSAGTAPVSITNLTTTFTVSGGSSVDLSFIRTGGKHMNLNGFVLSRHGSVALSTGDTLSGSGAISGVVKSAGGTVNPGVTTGDLETGDFTLDAASTFAVELDGTNTGDGAGTYDRVLVAGDVDITGSALTIDVGTFSPPVNSIYTVIVNDLVDSVTGRFSNAPNDGDEVTATNGTTKFKVFYSAGDGNDVVLIERTNDPITVYVDDDFSQNGGQPVTDADLGTSSDQGAIFGVTAFNTIADALAAVDPSGTIIVNGGDYNETVNVPAGITLEVTGPNASGTVQIQELNSVATSSIEIEGGSTLEVESGSIAGSIDGTGNLTKEGTGSLTLSGGDITYSGDTTVNDGRLVLSNAIGFASQTVDIGAELEVALTTQWNVPNITFTGDGKLIKSGSGTMIAGQNGTTRFEMEARGLIDVQEGVLRNNNRSGVWSSNEASMNIDSGAELWLYADNVYVDALTGKGTVKAEWTDTDDVLFVGVAGGSGVFEGTLENGSRTGRLNLTKVGDGIQTLTGINTYGGTTAIDNGTLQIGDDGATGNLGAGAVTINSPGNLTIDRNNTYTVTNEINGTGTLTQAGTGTTILNNSLNVTYSGATSIDEGTLSLQLAGSGGASSFNSAIDIASGATLDLTSSNGAVDNWVFDTAITGVSGSNITKNGAGWVQIRNAGGLGGFHGTLTINDGIFGNGYNGVGDWTGSTADVVVNGPGVLDLRTDNITINTLSGDGIVANTYGVLDAGGVNTLTIGVENGSSTFTGTILGAGGGSNNTSYDAGVISLIKTGTGTLTLSGSAANTHTGDTKVTMGALNLNKDDGVTAISGDLIIAGSGNPYARVFALADNQFGTDSTVNFTTANYAIFELLGTTQTVAGINSTSTYGIIQNQQFGAGTPGDGTLILNGSGVYSYTSFIRDRWGSGVGNLAIQKEGTGTQTLSGSGIDYTGTTSVALGSNLRLINTSAFRSSTNNEGDVEISATAGGSWTIANGNTLSGAGTWTKTGSGLATFANTTLTTTGQFNIQEGTLRNNNNFSDWSGSTAGMDISAGAILDLYADAVYVDELTGSGIIQNGYGNSSGFTGSEQYIEKLVVGVAGGSSTFSGVIRDNANGSAPASATAGGGIDLQKDGSGTLTLTGANTYSGTTMITEGTLSVENTTGSATGTGDVTVTSGTSLIGTGSMDSDVTVEDGGFVAPGLLPGDIADLGTGDFDLQAGSNITVELFGTGEGTTYDQLDVNGTVTLDGTLTLEIGFEATIDDQFRIIDNQGGSPVIRNFAGLLDGNFFTATGVNGQANQLFFIDYEGGDGNDVVLTRTTDPTTSIEVDVDGNVTIEDDLNDNTIDNLTIRVEAGFLVVTDPDNVIGSTVPGSSQSDLHTVRIPIGGTSVFTGNVIINTGSNTDSITIGDLGDNVLPGSIIVNGGAGQDRLIYNGAGSVLADGSDFDVTAEIVTFASGSSLTVGTVGGNTGVDAGGITVDARNDGTAGAGVGTFTGIELDGASLTVTGDGEVSMVGEGGDTRSRNHGIALDESSILSENGGIRLEGIVQGSNISHSSGVLLSESVVGQTGLNATGVIVIDGTAGAGTDVGSNNVGVTIELGSEVRALGDGSIDIDGVGAGGGSRSYYNYGVLITRESALSSENGTVSIDGTAGAGHSYNSGISLLYDSSISVSGSGDIDLSGTGGDGVHRNYGVGLERDVTLETGTGSILLTGTGGSGTTGNESAGVRITDSVVKQTEAPLVAGETIKIAGTGISGGARNAGVLIDFGSEITALGSTTLDIDGIGAAGNTFGFGVNIVGASALSSVDGDVTLDGTGGDGTGSTASNNMGVSLESASSVTVSGLGNIALTGTGGEGARGYNAGVALHKNGVSLETGSGSITVEGTAGGGVNSNYNRGVLITGSSLKQTAAGLAGAAITIDGTGGGTGMRNTGVEIDVRSVITALGETIIDIDGVGADGRGYSQGVRIGRSTSLSSENGNVTLDGEGGDGGRANQGVTVESGSGVTVSGTGSIMVNGTGGDGTGYNTGVTVSSGTGKGFVTNGGSISVEATSGTGSSSKGLVIGSRSVVQSLAGGSISLSGTSRGSGSNNSGLELNYVTVDTTGGVTLFGEGSSAAAANGYYNRGIYLLYSNITGSNLSITGLGGTGSNYNEGVRVMGGSLSGVLNLTGTANDATTGRYNTGVYLLRADLSGAGAGLGIFGRGGGGTGYNHGIHVLGSIYGGLYSGTAGAGNQSEALKGLFLPPAP